MFLIANRSFDKSYGCENFYEIKQDFIEILLPEIVLKIFSSLNLATLGTICSVSKQWKHSTNDPTLWKTRIYREIAFGSDKWAKAFGKEAVKDEDHKEEFASLPSDEFIKDCQKFKNLFPEKTARDCLMLVRLPKTLNGKLTLKSLGELAKKYFSNSHTGYRVIWPNIVDDLGDESIDTSYWVFMTKDILPKSRKKSYTEQQKIVDQLAEKALMNYKVPEILESAACILSQYFFDSETRLFNDSPWTYTRCTAKSHNYQALVGGFSPSGLGILRYLSDGHCSGVAALRKF